MSDALEQASLIMVPSGYENGTLGSLKPLDGSGDFTFSRGSDISATRVNEDGLIEKGYENLLLQSNQFDTNWVSIFTTETGGQTGYDGSSDAWLLTKTDANGRIYQSISSSGVQSISIYAKAGTLDWVRLQVIDAINNPSVFFDLQNGVIGVNAGANYVDSSIESIGTDGWYRLRITFDKAITLFNIYPAEGDNDTSGTSGSIYIQDAMLNQGLVAYPYVETTTAPVAGGILEDMPRLDYTDSSCPALLLEPQRTNLITSSEYFNDYFTKSRLSVSTNVDTAPDGLTTASKLIEDSTNQYHYISQAFGDVGNHTTSVYAKAAERSHIMLWNGGANSGQIFNLNSGTKGGVLGAAPLDSSIEDAGNGWYRCSVYNNSVSNAGVYISINDTSAFYQGDGASGVYIYGFQVEQDATYPTSYIPTYGTSQTRLVDSATASVTNTTSRTYFLDGKRLADEGVGNTSPVYYPNDNLKITFWTNNRFRFRFGGAINSYYTLVGDDFKIAISYNGTDSKIFVNGVYWMTQSSFNLGNISALSISGNEGISYNQLLLFPTALSDDECIALTTIS